jgi:hypothetical protein
MRSLVTAALLAALMTGAAAQSVGARRLNFPARPARPHPAGAAQIPFQPDAAGFRKLAQSSPFASLLYGAGGFADSSGPSPSNDPNTNAYPGAAFAPMLLMDALRGAGANAEPAPSSSPALLIELRGGQYVRVSDGVAAPRVGADREAGLTNLLPPKHITQNATPSAPSSRANKSVAAPREISSRATPPAVLMFRDGHREEVHDYAIVDGAIYARGDYYTDGYWNKKIELSSLNISETMKQNQVLGVSFRLPAAPNEVITRP